MSDVRMFRVPNKLGEKILKTGGRRAVELLADADQVMLDLREPCLADISSLISDINARYGKANRRGDEDFKDLYELSARIIDISAPVADLQIDRAAFFLCELVDRCSGQEKWDWPSVDVHLDALLLLRLDAGNLPAAAREKIFDGLKKINERLPSLATSEAAREDSAGES
ncbi:MAG: chemotaxis protein CheE [Caulobacteraceae bacterium]|nr:chemotaxis protein CheE [Caulobacteraceae bacterium]